MASYTRQFVFLGNVRIIYGGHDHKAAQQRHNKLTESNGTDADSCLLGYLLYLDSLSMYSVYTFCTGRSFL